MPQPDSSASAAERLRLMSLQADHAATLVFDWVRLERVLKALIEDLQRTEPRPEVQLDQCQKMLAFASHERAIIRDYAEGKQTACITLMERIQNGVYPDEAR